MSDTSTVEKDSGLSEKSSAATLQPGEGARVGLIRVRKDLAIDPAVRSASHLPATTSNACAVGVNPRGGQSLPISALGNVPMPNLHRRHLGIIFPDLEHLKEPGISQLVVQLQSLQNKTPKVYKPAKELQNITTAECSTVTPCEDGQSSSTARNEESSVCTTAPHKFPAVVPEHRSTSKLNSKRNPKGAAALAWAMKTNLNLLMESSSREVLGLSEDRWLKLQTAVLRPQIFRRSNWKLIQPPGGGVKVGNYSKQKVNKLTLAAHKEPEPVSNIAVLQSDGEVAIPGDFRIKITKKDGKYKCGAIDHGAVTETEFDLHNSDSWQPPPAKRRHIIYDGNDNSDIREVYGSSVKLWELKSCQLTPYVSVTKLQPKFFKPGNTYDLKDLKVAAMAQMLSTVVRKPGTVGKSVKSVLP